MMKRQAPPRQGFETVRLGKDEVNLVEYPFAALAKNAGDAVIEHTWETRHPLTGRTLRANWRVTGEAQLGLPTPGDERVYLVLMELTRETNFAQDVYFTRYDLLKRLKWPDSNYSYRMLREAFRRLRGVSISSENAFWDPVAKAFVEVGFGIIDNYEIVAERAGRKRPDAHQRPTSHFRWNDVIFRSLSNGYIRTLDLGLALSLKGPIALRLYRYLDKKAHDGKNKFEIELHRLCQLHLGMMPTTYASTLKVRLSPAHEELIDHGFLRGVTYKPMKSRDGEKVCYSFAARRELLAPSIPDAQQKMPAQDATAQDVAQQDATARDATARDATACDATARDATACAAAVQGVAVPGITVEMAQPQKFSPSTDLPSKEIADPLVQRLVDTNVSPQVAAELTAAYSIEHISLQLDCLVDRAPRDPAAALVSAIREGWAPPPAYTQRQTAAEQAAAAAEQAVIMAHKAVAAKQQRHQKLREVYLKVFADLSPAYREAILKDVGDKPEQEYICDYVARFHADEVATLTRAAAPKQLPKSK